MSHAASTSVSQGWLHRFKHFIIEPNESPEYGFQDRTITGIGFWMMQGASFAYSKYQHGCKTTNTWEKIAEIVFAIAIAVITSPLTLIGATIKAIGSQFPKRVGPLTSDMIPATSPSKIDQIYDMLQIIDMELRKNKILYSMDSGTLLGAVRSQGIIPWDDDGDLICRFEDKKALLALQDRFALYGILVEDTGLESLKFTFTESALEKIYGTTHQDAANVDICFMELDQTDQRIRPKSNFFKHQFPKEYFFQEEFDNQVDYPFGPPEKGLYLRGPADPRRYLATYYGQDSLQYAIRSHKHIQLGPFSFPLVNFSMTKYAIVPGYAQGNTWKSPQPA